MGAQTEEQKLKRKEYMKNYIKQRNIKIRGEPRKKYTEAEKIQKVKDRNKSYYLKNRDKLKDTARRARARKTTDNKLNKISELLKTLNEDEKLKILKSNI
jgi:hypothetical protein